MDDYGNNATSNVSGIIGLQAFDLTKFQEPYPPLMRELPIVVISTNEQVARTCIISYRWFFDSAYDTPAISPVALEAFIRMKSAGYLACLVDYITIHQDGVQIFTQNELVRYNELYRELPVYLAFNDHEQDTNRLWIDLEIWRFFQSDVVENI